MPETSKFNWPAPTGPNWRRSAPERLLDNPYFAVDRYAAVAPTGLEATYWVQNFKNLAVGVIPLHPDGTITLVGQWRFPADRYSWELPEGGVPAGEAALDGAKRELKEETGLLAEQWRHILSMQLSNASSDELGHVFLATGLSAAETDPDPTEFLTPVRAPFGAALAAVLSGDILDAMTVAGLLRLHHMAVTGALAPDLASAVLATVVG